MTSYYLVRHGVTDWIEQGIVDGSSDRPLSPFGIEQARLTAQALKDSKAVRLFTSPLKRTTQTAQPISEATGLKAEPLEGLREMDHGWLEGKRNMWRFLKRNKILTGLYFPIHLLIISLTGESRTAFRDHVLDAWKYIRSQEDGQPVIVVAHSGVIRTILMHEIGRETQVSSRYYTDTCSINEIECSPDAPSRLKRINDISHLNGKAHR